MGIMRATLYVQCENTFILFLNKLNKNPGKNFFALNKTHFNDINRYFVTEFKTFGISREAGGETNFWVK